MTRAILTVFILAATCSPVAAQGWADKMFKDGLTHDFGTVPHGAQLMHRFTITNIYAVRMEITGIVPSCGCVTYNAPKRFLEPRESAVLEVMMDAKRFTGPKSVTIRVSVGPEFISTAELKVTANSRADIVFNPGQVNFGTVARGQTPTQTIDVEYAGTLDWRVIEVMAQDKPLDPVIKELYRKPGQGVGVQLALKLKPDAPPGPFKETVYLRTNDPNTPLVPVLVEANIQAAVTVTPASFRLVGAEKVRVGEIVTRRVVVKGAQPFKILGIDGGGPEIQAEAAGPPAGQQTVVLRCRFNDPGDFKRQVQIRTDLQPEPLVVLVEANVVP